MRKEGKVYRIFAAVLLCVLAGFVIQEIYLRAIANRQIREEFPNTAQGKVSIRISASAGWTDKGEIGAQYDGIIYNHMKHDLRDWKVEIQVPEASRLDSAWNGAYVKEENTLTVTPVDYNSRISAQEAINFGFIMYSTEILDLQKMVLVGYPVIARESLPGFWMLNAAACLWLISFIAYLAYRMRIRKFEERRKSDAKIILQSMNTFAGLIDAKDSYTRGHSVRVAEYVEEIARRMGFSANEIEKLRYIALMHDCGKTGIPDAVLNKPDRLTPEERKRIEEHTVIGGEILENFTAIEGIRDGAMYHHERYDGKGYPQGRKAEEIPLYARIICVADSYDAMSSNRCYRKHLGKETILKELSDNAGTQFDPNIVKYMIDMIEDGFVDTVYAESADFM